jgi:hypothetical protein
MFKKLVCIAALALAACGVETAPEANAQVKQNQQALCSRGERACYDGCGVFLFCSATPCPPVTTGPCTPPSE